MSYAYYLKTASDFAWTGPSTTTSVTYTVPIWEEGVTPVDPPREEPIMQWVPPVIGPPPDNLILEEGRWEQIGVSLITEDAYRIQIGEEEVTEDVTEEGPLLYGFIPHAIPEFKPDIARRYWLAITHEPWDSAEFLAAGGEVFEDLEVGDEDIDPQDPEAGKRAIIKRTKKPANTGQAMNALTSDMRRVFVRENPDGSIVTRPATPADYWKKMIPGWRLVYERD